MFMTLELADPLLRALFGKKIYHLGALGLVDPSLRHFIGLRSADPSLRALEE